MKSRAKRLARLAAAQAAMARVAEAAHLTARADHARSAENAKEILCALGSDSPLHGLLTTVIAGALRQNTAETERLVRESERTGRVMELEKRRARVLSDRADMARRAVLRRQKSRALEDLVSNPSPERLP